MMTPEQVDAWKKRIDQMSPIQLVMMMRNGPDEHPIMDTDVPELKEYFEKRCRRVAMMHALSGQVRPMPDSF